MCLGVLLLATLLTVSSFYCDTIQASVKKKWQVEIALNCLI